MTQNSTNEPIILFPSPKTNNQWLPEAGTFTEAYLESLTNLDLQAKDRILQESLQILGNCSHPSEPSYSESGLVLGYVQSGKTQSFTTLAALARDNGYGLVIVLTGVTKLLDSQSIQRLSDDLGLDSWRIFSNPQASSFDSSDVFGKIQQRLTLWKKSVANASTLKATTLITILKNPTRLANLTSILNNLDLSEVPTLVIDDESDQASPNLRSARNLKLQANEESSTFARIRQMREALPKHTYLQYTATPQANLLAAKSDILSPAFARVISPGENYTGGTFFFGTPNHPNISLIPDEDTVRPNHLPEEPPESLLDALRSFWVGAAMHSFEIKEYASKRMTRSMMIQTSTQTKPHAIFKKWASAIQIGWSQTLQDPSRASHEELLSAFKSTHSKLAVTYPNLAPLEDLLEFIVDAIDETNIEEVNSTDEATKLVQWEHSPFWILIGGMKLDRGFTVRGITTTYMPRSTTENSDTLQQRARFFGYHGAYSGLCRVYLAQNSLDAFQAYLIQENALRESLASHEGKPLSEWKRTFVMNKALRKATRASVVGLSMANKIITDSWITPRYMHENFEAVIENQKTFETLINFLRLNGRPKSNLDSEIWLDKRKSSSPHVLFEGVDAKLIREFLFKVHLSNTWDTNLFTNLIGAMYDSPSPEPIDVVLMNDYSNTGLEGRNPTDKGVENLFIGRNPSSAQTLDQLIYVGDREIVGARSTLQLRVIQISGLTDDNNQAVDVPWLAFKPNIGLTQRILEEA